MDRIKEREERTRWFMEQRFGMFIHWGLYAIPGRGEWVMSDERILQKDYEKYFEEWNPDHYDPVKWARLAKRAGMKYAVFTAKHHEGFCLFDSAYTDYKSTNTACRRDLVREFLDAFRAEGLRVGLYYSLLDWHHPDYPAYGDKYHPERDNESGRNREHHFDRYLDYMHNQVRELMTDYGKIDLLWFDFSYEGHTGEDWRGGQLLEMVRTLQPGILVNGRLEGSGEQYGTALSDEPGIFAGDFACPEMVIPPAGLCTPSGKPVPWEACMTLNNNWGYTPTDLHYKTAEQVIRKLIECTSKNGNLLVNVSPTARGDIPREQVRILEAVGEWLYDNGESIYGCGRAELPKPEWGRFTRKGNRLFAHVTEPCVSAVMLEGLAGRIRRARRLKDGAELLLSVPAMAKEYGTCAFLNFNRPEYFYYAVQEEAATVIELELWEEGNESVYRD